MRIGWFTFTCCEDSSVLFVELMNDHFFEWTEKMEFAHCKFLKSNNDMEDLDVAFVEGAISSKYDLEDLKRIRGKCKKLVAIGSCACNGMPSAQRNAFDEMKKAKISTFLDKFGQLEKVLPLKEVVKVDFEVNGCPMDEKKFLGALEELFKEFGVGP